MNAKIQEILQKHGKSGQKELTFKVSKEFRPDMIDTNYPSVRLHKDCTFYTFDGRILNFNANNSMLSVPDETRDVLYMTMDDEKFIFFLSVKNKLEVGRLGCDGVVGEKSVLTRNVIDMGVCGSDVVYVFKKNKTVYTNVAFYDSGKWIGKRHMNELSGDNVKLFCCEKTFFLIVDGSVIKYPSTTLAYGASFVHQDDKDTILVIGYEEAINEERVRYELRTYDAKSMELDKEHESSMTLELSSNYSIVGHKDIIGIRDGKTLMFLQCDEGALKKVYIKEESFPLYAFDFLRNEEDVEVIALAERSYAMPVVAGVVKAENLNESMEKAIEAEEQVPEEGGAFSEPQAPIPELGLELHEMSLSVPQVLPAKKKNSLLDEVKESLDEQQRREKSFQSLAMQAKLKTEGVKTAVKPQKKQPNRSVTESEETKLERKPEFQGALRDAFVTVFAKNELFIKDLIAKVIVPPIEAAVNEMRVQVLAEVKKMMAAAAAGGGTGGDHIMNFKRKLAAGDINEGLKGVVQSVKDDDVESYLIHVSHDMLEEADADVLADLSVKIWPILKKSKSEILLRILLEVFASIDIAELSVDKIQALNILLRYCRNTDQISENFPGMGHVAYLMLKKIEKHTKSLSMKL